MLVPGPSRRTIDRRQKLTPPLGTSAGLGDLRAVVRIASHESSVQRGDIGDVTAESSTFFHLLVTEALVGTPLTDLGCLVTDLYALALFVAQVVDLGDSFCK